MARRNRAGTLRVFLLCLCLLHPVTDWIPCLSIIAVQFHRPYNPVTRGQRSSIGTGFFKVYEYRRLDIPNSGAAPPSFPGGRCRGACAFLPDDGAVDSAGLGEWTLCLDQ